jgi:hypothetical protein
VLLPLLLLSKLTTVLIELVLEAGVMLGVGREALTRKGSAPGLEASSKSIRSERGGFESEASPECVFSESAAKSMVFEAVNPSARLLARTVSNSQDCGCENPCLSSVKPIAGQIDSGTYSSSSGSSAPNGLVRLALTPPLLVQDSYRANKSFKSETEALADLTHLLFAKSSAAKR